MAGPVGRVELVRYARYRVDTPTTCSVSVRTSSVSIASAMAMI